MEVSKYDDKRSMTKKTDGDDKLDQNRGPTVV
jgi:hypothetical protein